MKKLNSPLVVSKKQIHFKHSLQLFLLVLFCLGAKAQQSYTFTTAGAVGSTGPTQTQVNTAYASTNLSAAVICTNGIQTWTVPSSGQYLIDVIGASGGSTNATYNKSGGLGSRMQGVFNLNAGNVLSILVGQVGVNGCGTGGGGGGSYVVNTGTLLIAAGGGGGASSDQLGGNSTTLSAGTNDNPGGAIPGGTNGSGGSVCNSGGANHGGGGGGYLGNGGTSTLSSPGGGGFSYTNGGAGGSGTAAGGFGGGGGGTNCTVGGGGGGGYSGGAGGQQVNYCMSGINRSGGGGGGSFNAGTSQTNTPAFNVGNGRVVIVSLCNLNLTSSGSNSLNPIICSGSNVTLTTNGVANYSWSNGASTSSIVVNPTVTTTYTLSATGASNCVASAAITVSVSAGLPTLSINTSTNLICLGRTITLTASGAITYTWNGGFANGVGFAPSTSTTYVVSGQNGCGTSTAAVNITVTPLSVLANVTPTLVCSGSVASLSAQSAVNSYTWLPGNLQGASVNINPISSTVYTVSASDGTCSGTATVALVTQPIPTITAIASASIGVCEGSPVVLTASGGVSYTWSPGNLTGPTVTVNPSGPTMYSVVASNSLGCTSIAYQPVITTPSPSVTISASNYTVCEGDQVVISASGASTYAWSNGINANTFTINPTSNSSYTVVGTTNGCNDIESIDIYVFLPTVAITGASTLCAQTTVTLTAAGALSYLWNTGATAPSILVSPNLNTVYSLTTTVSNGNLTCPATSSIQLTVFPNPTLTAVATRTSICKNETATLSVTGASTYTWSTNSVSSSIVLTPSLVTTSVYTVIGSNANNCTATTSIQLKINACTGLLENSKNAFSFKVYPNPSSGEFFVESDYEINLVLLNQIGQTIKVFSLSKTNNYKLEISGLSNGIYFLNGVREGRQLTTKIVVSK